jgi:hypothetical protein
VRNGWKGMRWSMFAALSAWASLPAVAAQGAQTAAGAQQFLAAMAKKVVTQVDFVDAAGRTNYVTGTYSGEVKTIKGGAFGKPKESIAPLPERSVDKQVTDVRAAVLEPIDAAGRPNACATRITEVVAPPYDDVKSDSGTESRTFTFTLTYTNEQWKYEPLTKFMSPAQVIDWSDAKISRSPNSSITVTSKGQSFTRIQLTYAGGDLDLADRIEYAMKFLAMSCDYSAKTGF